MQQSSSKKISQEDKSFFSYILHALTNLQTHLAVFLQHRVFSFNITHFSVFLQHHIFSFKISEWENIIILFTQTHFYMFLQNYLRKRWNKKIKKITDPLLRVSATPLISLCQKIKSTAAAPANK